MISAVARKKAKTIADRTKPILSGRSVRSFRSSLKSSKTINSIVKTSKKLLQSLQRNFTKWKQSTFSKGEPPEDELPGQKDVMSAQAVERYKVKANWDSFAVHDGYRTIPHPFYHDIPRRHPARLLHIPLRMESEETFFFLGFTAEKAKELWLEYSGNDITSSKAGDIVAFAQTYLKLIADTANRMCTLEAPADYWARNVGLRMKKKRVDPNLVLIDPPPPILITEANPALAAVIPGAYVAQYDWWYDMIANRYNFLYQLEQIISGKREADWMKAKVWEDYSMPRGERVYPHMHGQSGGHDEEEEIGSVPSSPTRRFHHEYKGDADVSND
ncbi:hypothetical protein MMC31_005161 [Peltigera leucophlebia]|nr:hypothetical protein [Peltigera leucophlebia]